jgi:tape measure domain-containing protein
MGRPANLVVNILGNNSDLAKALGSSDSALGKFGAGANAVMTGIATKWTAAATAGGIFVASVFKSGVAYNQLNQTATAAFKTILGSADAAAAMMDQITAFSKKSPFPKQAFIEATQQMLGFGIASSKVIPYLGAIQDAVAATGGSAQQIKEISLIMSQISAAGKITGQDLMQFAQRGIDAASLIGSQMGMTGAQIKDAISKGSLDAGTALDALAAGMETRFAHAADNVKQTWAGATDRIKGAMRDIGSALAEPFVSKSGGGMAVTWANQIADILRTLEPLISGLVSKFTGAFAGGLGGIGGILDAVLGKLKGVNVDQLTAGISNLAPALATITGAFAAMSTGALKGIPLIGELLGGLSGPIGIVIAAIAGLVATSPELQAVFGGVMQQALKALAPLLPVLSTALGAITTALSSVVEAAAPLIAVFAGALSTVLQALVPLIAQLAQAVLPIVATVITMLVPIVTQLVDAFMPLLPVITDLITQLLPPLATVVLLVIGAIQPLLPIVVQLAKIIVNLLVTAITPLIPAFVQIIKAVIPILPPIAQLIALIAALLGPILNLIAPLLQLAGPLLGGLLTITSKLISGALGMLAPIFNAIADAIAGVVKWLSKIQWPQPPKWLSDLTGGGKSTFAVSSTSSTFAAGTLSPAVYAAAGYRSAAAPRIAAPSPIQITVQAPFGGGDAIARAIRAELQGLARRERGVILGGQVSYP